jgi:hypothetical protein
VVACISLVAGRVSIVRKSDTFEDIVEWDCQSSQ